ncbi:alkyl sulfatase dimerization domain-containing protein [Sulfuritalea sp.]|uniref:alkyl/aryl-sulfatase n=1 Tax=Sulfuritalea sp. TaxID=2480090 RepID=UPI001ACA22F4|nr:alkyl sulfatase dimerization domain-containing protein [Sulfuritalea sp.]MBN8476373.1 MBL fold metallo-hydrolase [Sulfuritalea sp.]
MNSHCLQLQRRISLLAMIGATALLGGCGKATAPAASGGDVTAVTAKANEATAKAQDLSDPKSFEDAKRGFIAAPTGQVRDAAGNVIWDFDSYAFVKGPAPATVNPSLWRQALLNNQVGLFKVTEGIYQLRGFDLANITLIEGKTGWIVVDTLTARETATAAMAFARKHLGDKPVSAVIFTHSHVDHFGGALGVISAEEVARRKLPVVAPSGFMDEATSENIMMGVAMARRSMYMYGGRLPRDAKGSVDTGLGKAVAYGQVGILPPTVVVDQPRQELTIDGLRFVFHNVPGSEAPAEFVFYIPERKAFGGAEMLSHTLHNLYTLRGAKVRDALKWADYIDQSLVHAADAEVIFNQHHWPVWGQERIREFMVKQRDTYKFIHDQTVRQMNAGLTAPEIAETLKLPKSLDDYLNVHGYYGTVRHNAKAVYQFYLGWFDAHPSNLDALPPVEAGKRYVILAGGIDKLAAAAQAAFDAGDYRWAAEMLKHAVYAEPKNKAASELLARSFEQLGYVAESAPWRNFYLTGAYELRNGVPQKGITIDMLVDMLQYAPIERFLERMAASLDGAKAADANLRINLVFSDLKESYVLQIDNAVLHYHKAPPDKDANATLTLTKAFFLKMMTGQAGAKELLLSDQTKIEGSKIDLGRFFSLIEKAPGVFPIVTR